MKKITLLLAAVLISGVSFGQKSKKPVKAAASNKSVLAKSGNLTAELLKKKNDYSFYVIVDNKTSKDTLSLKSIPGATTKENLPVNCTITPFNSKGTALYSIAWTEKNYTEIPDKKEDKTTTVTEIWNAATKTQLHSNVQASTKITEILWLDKGKNASQTSEKMRNEGFVLTLSPEGDIILKNKTQENKLVYDAAENKYNPVKSAQASTPTTKPAAKKRR